MADANRWDSEWMSQCPSYVTWDVPGQGLLLRAFHLHPVAFRVQKDSPDFFVPFYSTLDEEFVARFGRTNPRVYVCQSSDELGVCSLAENSDSDYRMVPPRPTNIGDLTVFAETYAGLLHRELFNQSIRLVIDNVVESRWEPSESEAAASLTQMSKGDFRSPILFWRWKTLRLLLLASVDRSIINIGSVQKKFRSVSSVALAANSSLLNPNGRRSGARHKWLQSQCGWRNRGDKFYVRKFC